MKSLPCGIYGITAEEFANGRSNIQCALEMAKGGVSILQYREKNNDKSIRRKYEECKEIRKITSDYGILFIVNDFIDIALSVNADGIHIGQDDIPLIEANKLAEGMIVGISTHSPEQAQKAITENAGYIGVGPIFKTYTKKNVCEPVGLEYLDYIVKNTDIPFVAIGGIKKHNIEDVLSKGAKTIALVTEIVSAEDIAGEVKKIKEIINNYFDI